MLPILLRYVEYVEYYRRTVAIIIRRRRIAAAIAMHLLKKEKRNIYIKIYIVTPGSKRIPYL